MMSPEELYQINERLQDMICDNVPLTTDQAEELSSLSLTIETLLASTSRLVVTP